jgi:membrane-bound lytic murein transglycosylase B
MKKGFISLASIIIIAVIIMQPFSVFAQSSNDAEEAQLRSELAQLQAEIAQKQAELDGQKKNSASLSKDVSILTTQIQKAKLEIIAKNKVLGNLTGQIGQKNKVIETLDNKRTRQEKSLSQILRKKNQIDDSSLAELLLSRKTLSGFLGEIDNLQSVDQGIQESFGIIKTNKQKTNQEKEILQEKKEAENNVKYQLETQKKQVEVTQNEKERMLVVSKGQEKNYENVIADRKKRVSQINARLFSLRGQKGIAFGDALRYAKEAYNGGSGVRPALVLAILTQESNLGKNVGGCYLSDKDTGAGKRISTGEQIATVMKPTRDVSPFMSITSALGRDPYATSVSCPIKSGGSYSGYGGAMGPSQFIPSTWVLYKSKIASIAGASQADPWNPEHAIIATSLLMRDNGANGQTYTTERNAACKYYSGRACSGSNEFYGNSVMKLADKLQTDIDFLSGN